MEVEGSAGKFTKKWGASRTFKLLGPRIREPQEEFLRQVRDAKVNNEGDLEEDHEGEEHDLGGYVFSGTLCNWRARVRVIS
jgi:hypothetical protein